MSLVRIKGNKNGIALIITEDAEFSIVYQEIERKISQSRDFFKSGVEIAVNWGGRAFDADERRLLKSLLAQYGLIWVEAVIKTAEPPPVTAKADAPPIVARAIELDGYESQAMVINKTLRSGARVIYDGLVVVFGDVNAGAEVIAGRDIIVNGICRGLVHAGAFGARDARIIAQKLKPVQIRIADCIARAPDGGEWPDNGSGLEMAFIDDGKLSIRAVGK